MNLEELVDTELRPVLSGIPEWGDITADPTATRKVLADMIAAARGDASNPRVTIENRQIPGPEDSFE